MNLISKTSSNQKQVSLARERTGSASEQQFLNTSCLRGEEVVGFLMMLKRLTPPLPPPPKFPTE